MFGADMRTEALLAAMRRRTPNATRWMGVSENGLSDYGHEIGLWMS